MSKLVEIFRSVSTVEAQMFAHRLKENGIHTVMQGENLASAIGIGAFVAPCRVLVREDQVDEVRAIIAVMDAAGELARENAPEKCSACGEDWEPGFEECWSCQAPMPAG